MLNIYGMLKLLDIISISTNILCWIDKKELSELKVGKKWLFRKEEIDVWHNSLNSLDNKEER